MAARRVCRVIPVLDVSFFFLLRRFRRVSNGFSDAFPLAPCWDGFCLFDVTSSVVYD